jgi:hypothetical protein
MVDLCKRGHNLTDPTNISWEKSKAGTGRPWRRCLVCKRITSKQPAQLAKRRALYQATRARKLAQVRVHRATKRERLVRNILESVAEAWGVTVEDLTGKARDQPLQAARSMAMALIRERRPRLSIHVIAEFMNRDTSGLEKTITRVTHWRTFDQYRTDEMEARMILAERLNPSPPKDQPGNVIRFPLGTPLVANQPVDILGYRNGRALIQFRGKPPHGFLPICELNPDAIRKYGQEAL